MKPNTPLSVFEANFELDAKASHFSHFLARLRNGRGLTFRFKEHRIIPNESFIQHNVLGHRPINDLP